MLVVGDALRRFPSPPRGRSHDTPTWSAVDPGRKARELGMGRCASARVGESCREAAARSPLLRSLRALMLGLSRWRQRAISHLSGMFCRDWTRSTGIPPFITQDRPRSRPWSGSLRLPTMGWVNRPRPSQAFRRRGQSVEDRGCGGEGSQEGIATASAKAAWPAPSESRATQ